ncbi:thiamine-phosphate kinase [Aeromicrobium alkaliterrae]|uniref:Thiamine-monophosphate kinase n=1 Tax=Aeromicrobium alkaliterrae TaxID=302168 RepID=A0ABP4VS87_9ACTN
MQASGGGTRDLTVETVSELGEFGLVERITRALPTTDVVLVGPGDDAAEISVGGTLVVSTDVLVDQRHFRRDWSTAHEVGRKSAASNLSDINAMGGHATALTLGLAVPGDLPVAWVDELVRGVVEECALVGAAVVGGDVTASDTLVIAVTVVGEATRTVRRSGAQVGDVVAVAGTLGLAGAGFAALSRGFRSPRAAVEAHRVPHPPYGSGETGADAGATAMIDVSDGLLGDLGHVARASGVQIDLSSEHVPIESAVITVAEALGRHPVSFVLTGGDDYALAATFPPEAALPDDWYPIGAVVAVPAGDQPRVTVDGLPWDGETGHEHFR